VEVHPDVDGWAGDRPTGSSRAAIGHATRAAGTSDAPLASRSGGSTGAARSRASTGTARGAALATRHPGASAIACGSGAAAASTGAGLGGQVRADLSAAGKERHGGEEERAPHAASIRNSPRRRPEEPRGYLVTAIDLRNSARL